MKEGSVMLRSALVLICVLLFTFPASAAPWFCSSEQVAIVYIDKNGVPGSEAGKSTVDYLIDDNGFKLIGDEIAILDECRWINDAPISCKKSGDKFVGWFQLNEKTNAYRYYGTALRLDDTVASYVEVGRCRRLSE